MIGDPGLRMQHGHVLKNRIFNISIYIWTMYKLCQMIEILTIGSPSFLRLMKMEKRKGIKNKTGLVFPKKWVPICQNHV